MLAIGAVDSASARIWVRVNRPGGYTLTWCRAEGGETSELPLDVHDLDRDLTACATVRQGLEPDTRYRITLHRGPREPLATGGFVTAPADASAAPQHFSLALMSCHQPFDRDGRVATWTEPMLEAVNRVLLEHRVRAVVMCGDQLYSDYPQNLSLFDAEYFREVAPAGRDTLLDCTAQEVRALFHQRYRHFWNISGWRQLLANYPCYPILDDHEIVDNWGSVAAHQEEMWKAFREGAFQAYADYQGARVSDRHATAPPCFDYPIELADIAVWVMDLRSNRRMGKNAQLVSPEQIRSLERFLNRHAERSAVFIVLSVPLLHLPSLLARLVARITPDGEDFSDRWSARGHCRDRDAVLGVLHDHQVRHPGQQLVLLSGDIHIGCLHRIRWKDRTPCFYQFISSGVTHDAGPVIRHVSSTIMALRHHIRLDADSRPDLDARISRVRGERGAQRNPCGELNVGIIELERDDPGCRPTLRFLLYSHDGTNPRCTYRSPAITAPDPGPARRRHLVGTA